MSLIPEIDAKRRGWVITRKRVVLFMFWPVIVLFLTAMVGGMLLLMWPMLFLRSMKIQGGES